MESESKTPKFKLHGNTLIDCVDETEAAVFAFHSDAEYVFGILSRYQDIVEHKDKELIDLYKCYNSMYQSHIESEKNIKILTEMLMYIHDHDGVSRPIKVDISNLLDTIK